MYIIKDDVELDRKKKKGESMHWAHTLPPEEDDILIYNYLKVIMAFYETGDEKYLNSLLPDGGSPYANLGREL
jgi:hypothetical protein